MARKVTLAATQMACTDDNKTDIETAEALVRTAASMGANIVLLQELFEGCYFCQDELPEFLNRAKPADGHPTLQHFSSLANELGVVLPVSFFERAGNARFNSVAIIDADGKQLGIYRKSHIPHGSGYQEKFYFSPGDTGFKVWATGFGTIGVGICWDQWFPECARSMALMGAEMLFYPTAIGSELLDPGYDSSGHWQRVMQGHAGANIMPLVASNRIGTEPGRNGTKIRFYGTSFITNETGEVMEQAGRTSQEVLAHTFDLDQIRELRSSWGVFRDRRPELYGPISTLDGQAGFFQQ